LRDCLRGLCRVDQFQKNLAISPNMLTRRLQTLVDAGLLERHQYCEHPPRYEHLLTERGRDFRTVIAAVFGWGSRNFGDGDTTLPEAQHAGDDVQKRNEEI